LLDEIAREEALDARGGARDGAQVLSRENLD